MKAILLAATLGLGASLAAQDKTPPLKVPDPPAAGAVRAAARPRVQLVTSCGNIVVELEPEAAPGTVANFLRYVAEGFYTDTIFHRVIDGFMIQGGGLRADLTEKKPHEPIPNEARTAAKAGLLNRKGTLAMARQDNPQSATAQFYINTADNPALDPRDPTDAGFGYCVFGHVVEGMAVVTRIEKVRTGWFHGQQNVPDLPVRIKAAQRLPDQP